MDVFSFILVNLRISLSDRDLLLLVLSATLLSNISLVDNINFIQNYKVTSLGLVGREFIARRTNFRVDYIKQVMTN